jgi:hypothetical protein
MKLTIIPHNIEKQLCPALIIGGKYARDRLAILLRKNRKEKDLCRSLLNYSAFIGFPTK